MEAIVVKDLFDRINFVPIDDSWFISHCLRKFPLVSYFIHFLVIKEHLMHSVCVNITRHFARSSPIL